MSKLQLISSFLNVNTIIDLFSVYILYTERCLHYFGDALSLRACLYSPRRVFVYDHNTIIAHPPIAIGENVNKHLFWMTAQFFFFAEFWVEVFVLTETEALARKNLDLSWAESMSESLWKFMWKVQTCCQVHKTSLT